MPGAMWRWENYRPLKSVPILTHRDGTLGSAQRLSQLHQILHEKRKKIVDLFEALSFNSYLGPEAPELLIVASGSGWLYSMEAVRTLSLGKAVGVLKLGTTWPLPAQFLRTHLSQAERILVIEEVDPFLEANLKEFIADNMPGKRFTFFGKSSGHIKPYGELNVDLVMQAIATIMSINFTARDAAYERKPRRWKKLRATQDIPTVPGLPSQGNLLGLERCPEDGRR